MSDIATVPTIRIASGLRATTWHWVPDPTGWQTSACGIRPNPVYGWAYLRAGAYPADRITCARCLRKYRTAHPTA